MTVSTTEKRLELSIEDLDRVARRLCRDHVLTGGNGPLAEAYHAVLKAKLEIEQYEGKPQTWDPA